LSTYINNNPYGIRTQAGTDIRIENDAQNDFSDNDVTIDMFYGKLFANHGYNRLQSVNNDNAVSVIQTLEQYAEFPKNGMLITINGKMIYQNHPFTELIIH
jgi:hypothetical protein